MNARLYIKTDDIVTDLNFKEIKDKNYFEGIFDGEKYNVKIINENIVIERSLNNQKTLVNINKNGPSNIEIINENGSILLDIKVVEIIVKNDMISTVYTIDDRTSELKIEFY